MVSISGEGQSPSRCLTLRVGKKDCAVSLKVVLLSEATKGIEGASGPMRSQISQAMGMDMMVVVKEAALTYVPNVRELSEEGGKHISNSLHLLLLGVLGCNTRTIVIKRIDMTNNNYYSVTV